jgi:hypothetical protein
VDPQWISAAVALATFMFIVIGWIIRKVWKGVSALMHFIDDYNGEAAAPGRPERPGVMQRLSRVEDSNARLEKITSEISSQVHLNSGASLRDSVQRTEMTVRELQTSVKIISEQIANGRNGP